MNIKTLSVALALLALFGCASPTRYERAEGYNEGYSDQRLAENRYRVTFRGNSSTQREAVEDYLLLRAAEVTLESGYSWFVFDERSTQAKTTYYYDTFGGYPGWGPTWAHHGWYWHNWAHDPWDPFWSHGHVFPSTRYEAYAEIVLLTPEAAKRDAHAIDAKEVIARLGPAVAPSPKS